MLTLTWGLDDLTIKEKFPGAYFGNKWLGLPKGGLIYNFPGDCGSLLIQGANTLNAAALKDIEEYASLSGFSKLFATIVTSKDYADNQMEIMKRLGWKCVSKGYSNRNPEKRDYVMFKRVKCSYHGY